MKEFIILDTQSIVGSNYKIHINICHLLKFSNMQLNTTLEIILTFYNTHKFK